MKTKLFLMLILLAQAFYAQDLTGSWRGEIDLGGMKLPLILDVKKENSRYISTAKSPKQGNQIITVDKTEFSNNELIFEMNELKAAYKGQYKTDHFEGTFEQNSRSFALNLYRYNGSENSNSNDEKVKDIGNREINISKIDDFLNYLTSNKQAVGSVSIFRKGKEIYQRNFGQDQLSNVKWNSHTQYHVGSISKLFTAVMLMQQIEKGKLNISDKLSKYFPDIPNANKITIEKLLNHTSGLSDYVGQNYQWLFKKPVGDKVILDTIRAQGVEFEPGEKTRYSNSGYYLLSRILEKVTNKPYHVLLKENITSKANMKNTFSVLDNPKNVFKSYKPKDGEWVEIEDFDFHNCIGLGDIVSTPFDLNVFINNLFRSKFVKKETLERMMPKPSSDLKFGLGIMPAPFYNQVSFGHGGDTAGSHSITFYNTKEDYSISMVVNGEKFPHNDLSIGILNIIYDLQYDYPKFVEAKKLPENELKKYEGEYHSKETNLDFKIFIDEETLFAQLTGQSSFPLEFVEDNKFKYDNAGVEIVFAPEKKELTLIQNGNMLVFNKK